MAGGRRSPHGGGTISTVPPAASMACGRSARRRGPDGERPWSSSPRPSTFTRPRLATRPRARSSSGLTSLPASNALERVEVDHVVLDPERVVEALELRRAAGERRLATLEPGLDRAARALALGAAAGGLAALAADAAADPLARLLASRRPASGHGPSCEPPSSTATRCGTLASIPRITGGVVVLDGLADPAQAERAERAALLRLDADVGLHLRDLQCLAMTRDLGDFGLLACCARGRP